MSLAMLESRLASENVDIAAGTLEEDERIFQVRGLSRFRTPADVANVVVRYLDDPNGQRNSRKAIRVADLGTVELVDAEIDHLVLVNGAEGVGLAVYKEAGSNTVGVSAAVQDALAGLHEDLPGVDVHEVANDAGLVTDALDDLKIAAGAGIVLAVLVLAIFLRSAGATLIVAASVPVSVFTALFFMTFADHSLNIVTLGGLALGAGMLVDNAIVVVESMYRRVGLGDSPVDAAAKGTGQVAGAIVASTLTTCVVFLPVLFVQGLAARLIDGIAFTVVVSLLASLAVAVFLIPALGRWFLPAPFEGVSAREADTETLAARARRGLEALGCAAVAHPGDGCTRRCGAGGWGGNAVGGSGVGVVGAVRSAAVLYSPGWAAGAARRVDGAHGGGYRGADWAGCGGRGSGRFGRGRPRTRRTAFGGDAFGSGAAAGGRTGHSHRTDRGEHGPHHRPDGADGPDRRRRRQATRPRTRRLAGHRDQLGGDPLGAHRRPWRQRTADRRGDCRQCARRPAPGCRCREGPVGCAARGLECALVVRGRTAGTAGGLGPRDVGCARRRHRCRRPGPGGEPGWPRSNPTVHRRRGTRGQRAAAGAAPRGSRQRGVPHPERASGRARRGGDLLLRRGCPRGVPTRPAAHRPGHRALERRIQSGGRRGGGGSGASGRAVAARTARPAARSGRRARAHLRRIAVGRLAGAGLGAHGAGRDVRVPAATVDGARRDPAGADRRGGGAGAGRPADRRHGDARVHRPGGRGRQRRGPAHHDRPPTDG